MNIQLVAVLIQEGSRFLSGWLKSRTITRTETTIESESPKVTLKQSSDVQAAGIPTGCIPCSISHYGTCTGLLNEAMRFARSDGLGSPEVIDRVNMCIDELNAMERVDLRPEMIVTLPEWEKNLADKALIQSRSLRHGLENLSDSGQLEHLAAETQSVRQDIGRAWFQSKLAKMTPKEQAEIQERVILKLKEGT